MTIPDSNKAYIPRDPPVPEPAAAPPADPAVALLQDAIDTISGNRRATYGNPEDDFACVAGLWQAYLDRRKPGPLLTTDVAAMMVMLKVARLAVSPAHQDSWLDVAGYAACGWRCVVAPGKTMMMMADRLTDQQRFNSLLPAATETSMRDESSLLNISKQVLGVFDPHADTVCLRTVRINAAKMGYSLTIPEAIWILTNWMKL